MTQSEVWRNGRERTILDVQEAPGEPWGILDVDYMMAAPSGGRQGAESRWGRDVNGNSLYLGTTLTGNPARSTFNVSTRLRYAKILGDLIMKVDPRPGCGCDEKSVNLRVRNKCGSIQDINNYDFAIVALDAVDTSQSFSQNLANSDTGDDQDVMISASMSAGVLPMQKKLVHQNVQGTHSDFAYNVIKYRCAKEWWAGTDADNTPGYVATPAPKVVWTEDDWETSSSSYVGVFLSGNITDLVIVGERVLVVSPTNGIAYARIQDLKDGISNPWVLASGISSNFPTALSAVGSTVWAVGAGGRIWKSTDGGFTFSLTSNGTVTAQNLNTVVFDNENLGWAAGASGTLLRYLNGNWGVIAVSGLSATINVVRIPAQRTDQVYLGTANGNIYRSKNAMGTVPVFETRAFPQSGNGQIKDIQFVGFRGAYMFVLQSDVDANTRVIRDNSGGAMGNDAEIIGAFSSPDNNGINSIALATPNTAFVVGENVNSYGYIGSVKG